MLDPRLGKIEAIVFDLDDTLYAKADWAVPALEHAADAVRLDKHRVWELATQYVQDRGCADAGIFNSILLGCGQSDSAHNMRALVSAVNSYRPHPGSLQMYPGVVDLIISLSGSYKLAIMADGEVACQRAKVRGLGLKSACRTIVYSDEIAGLKSRRPDSRPYYRVLERLKTRANCTMFVGDNPFKDFIRARQLGLLAVRVHTGEYADSNDPSPAHQAEYDLASVAALSDLLTYGKGTGVFVRTRSNRKGTESDPDQTMAKQ